MERLATELGAVFAKPGIAERLVEIGAQPQPRPMSVSAFEAYVQAETEKWAAAVREADIRME